jgi:AraC-like DNA-binding protein
VSSWRGRLFLGLGRLLYVGPVGSTDLHAHHAFQCMRARSGTVGIRDERGAELPVVAAVIPPDTPHAITAPAPDVTLLYVEPESHEGRRLLAMAPPTTPLPAWRSATLANAATIDAVDIVSARGLIDAWLTALCGPWSTPRPFHPGLRRALRAVDDHLEEGVRAEALAAIAGLSASRLSHLFAEEVGLGLRPYVLWRRLARTARAVSSGLSLTEAAHAAGFADAAHLSRTFRRMFGLAPSEVAGWVDWQLLDEEAAS